MAMQHEGLLELFLEEAQEHLDMLEDGLLQIEKRPHLCCSLVDGLFRSAHTVKGSAALMKLGTISSVAHHLEDALELLRDRNLSPAPDDTDAMLFALDQIRTLAEVARRRLPEPPGILDAVMARIHGVGQGGGAHGASADSAAQPQSPREKSYPGPVHPEGERRSPEASMGANQIRVGADRIDAMMRVLGDITVTKTHLLTQLRQMVLVKEEIRQTGRRLNLEVGRFSEKYAYSLPEQKKTVDTALSEFAELEFDQYDEINLFARKLEEITNDVNEAMRSLAEHFGRFSGELGSLDLMTSDLKEQISEARTVPAGNLFQRFTRTVRELGRQTGREIELVTAGAETLIDRAIYDGLYDPLLHLVRNAVSHGFETPEERRRLGKPQICTLTLSARRQGNRVEIEIEDDGRGIQFDRIRARALSIGLLRPEEEASEKALLDMIFKPGFSTNEEKDMVSGRGVGMNVVMDRLAALNGTIRVSTKEGEGSCMRLNLPLSLVIVNVVHFRVGASPMVLPSSLISELVYLAEGEGEQGSIEVRGETVPLIDLNAALGWPRRSPEPPRFVILTQSAGMQVGLLVEEILSQEDTVIRPFKSFLMGVPHVAGTSLAGDGTLRLVLNPVRLRGASSVPVPVPAQESVELCVLLVDDSLSVRKFASALLEKNGIAVLTATNGLEALGILDEKPVAMVLTDLEMPVMHGFELLGELGRRGRLSDLRVAVLSSRAGEQHRRKAFELGAVDYLVKPFDEGSLLAVIRRFTDLAD